jgi:hypothetical protein
VAALTGRREQREVVPAIHAKHAHAPPTERDGTTVKDV